MLTRILNYRIFADDNDKMNNVFYDIVEPTYTVRTIHDLENDQYLYDFVLIFYELMLHLNLLLDLLILLELRSLENV